MRCRHCAALNPDSAAWCNQCLNDMGSMSGASEGTGAGTVGAPGHGEADRHTGSSRLTPLEGPGTTRGGSTAGPGPEAGNTGSSASIAEGGRVGPNRRQQNEPHAAPAGFRTQDDDVQWNCPDCESWASIDERVCPHCQTPFGTGSATQEPHRLTRGGTRGQALLGNAVLPGLGHLLAGWTGSGLARMVLFIVWILGGIALLGAGGTKVALPLLLGAAALWSASLFDAWQLNQGGVQLLNGRTLLWLVVTVTVLATMGVAAAALTASA